MTVAHILSAAFLAVLAFTTGTVTKCEWRSFDPMARGFGLIVTIGASLAAIVNVVAAAKLNG